VTLPLTPNVTYYWYVKPTYGTPSQIFSLSTTDPPINTTPADGGTPNPGLTFRWVNPADSFDIYISQTMQDVDTLDPAALVKTGVVGNEWFPEHDMIDFILSGDVDYGGEEEVYYWRVVAISSVGPPAPSEMTSFTTGSNELIDNFGSDTNSDHLYRRAVGDEFVAGNGKATWTASGSAKIFMVDNSISEPNKVGPADNNGTSLRIDYKDSAGIATATCVFANTRDWSSAVNRASMRFQLLGLAGNSEQIKVTVTDTSDTSDFVTFLADDDQTEEAMTAGSWNNFTAIDLSIADMTAIDQSSIKSFSISVGNGVGSDEGAVWIDNIQIHRVRCLGKMIPYYFSAGDCAADVNELEVIASKWLRDVSATTVTAAVSPPSPSPVLHHDFETFTLGTTFTGIYGNELARWIKSPEPAGGNQSSDVYDSGYLSGNNNSMRVNSTTRMETSSFTNLPTGNWTLSIWVKPDQVTDHLNPDGTIVQQRPWRLRGGPDNQQTYMRLNIFDSDGDTSAAGAGLGSNLSEDVDVIAIEGTWTHVAYVHDYDNLSSALYVNGLKINENTDDEDLLPFPSQVGNMRMPHNNADNGYNGLTDEVRLYDYALSHEDILYLADVGSVSQPVLGVSMAGDLNGDETWNIIDLAELSASYHKDDVWWP
ncbi:MAG: LamG domain-containing protein, partial [Planctomycetes bacterium]|nr:LamG domain-containing protein [Planctomycetota bacterium]